MILETQYLATINVRGFDRNILVVADNIAEAAEKVQQEVDVMACSADDPVRAVITSITRAYGSVIR